MKRFLALALVLCTLLCMIPFAVSAETGEPEANAVENDASYIDFYVKDGLVALFDGYSVTASDEQLTLITPVNLYGNEFYPDYIDPSNYTADLQLGTDAKKVYSAGLANGAYSINKINASKDRTDEKYSFYIDLDDLGALVGTTYTVQEVCTVKSWAAPIVTDGVVSNYADLGVAYQNTGSLYGILRFTAHERPFTSTSYTGTNGITGWGGGAATPWIQLHLNSSFRGHIVYAGEAYGSTVYGALSANNKDFTNAYVNKGATTVERSVIRYGVSYDSADGKYTSTYAVRFQQDPLFRTDDDRYQNATNQISYTSADGDVHNGTSLRVMAECGGEYYSIRIYNVTLTDAQRNQNHFADLLGFYKVDSAIIAGLAKLSTHDVEPLIAELSATQISVKGYADENYSADKEALEEKLRAAVVEEPSIDYIDLYVKDGLVALFNGHEIEADESASVHSLNEWMVDLSGVEGYEDFIDPSLYTVNAATGGGRVTYRQQDGGIGIDTPDASVSFWNANAAFDMSTLGALIGTTYSVQEVFSYGTMIPVIENNVITNYSELVSASNYAKGWAFGSFKGGTSRHIGTNVVDTNSLLMVGIDQLAFGDDYKGHWLYFGEGLNTTKYDSLTALDANGDKILNEDSTEKVFEDYYVGGAVSVERTFIRLGYTSKDVEKEGETVTQYTSTYKTFFNNKPWHRTGGDRKAPNTTISFTSADEAAHASTTLRVANMGLTRAIRVYNRELNKEEIYQNHLADICAVYDIDIETINAVKALSAPTFKALCEAAYEIEITPTNDGWTDVQLELVALIGEYLTKEEAMMNAVVSFGGMSYRTSGNYGLRVMFTVDKDAIAYLEECGYTVEYGAIMAVKSNGGTEYNASASDLTVKVGEDGKVALASGNAATIVSTDSEKGLKHLTEDNVSFAFTTVYAADGTDADLYDATMLYRGFAVVTDAEGNATIVYDELNVLSDPALNTPSLRALHNYVLANDQTLSEEMRKRLSFE